MAIDFQNLKFNLNKTRPVGYKYPAGLSFGLSDYVDAATQTINDSTNFVTVVNETDTSPAVGPAGSTANTSLQWNSSGTFIPKFTGEVEVLVVAGGGGAGVGGGGAGGLTYVSNQPVTEGTEYNCLVGAGGTWDTNVYGGPPQAGTHSSGNIQGPNAWNRGGFSSNIAEMPIITTGGGGGANQCATNGDNSTFGWNQGGPGGSGGGGARGKYRPSTDVPYTSPSAGQSAGGSNGGIAGQGHTGGSARLPPWPPGSDFFPYGESGAGGGAAEAGESGRSDHVGAAGGDGLEYSISGSPVYYAGGGGGGGGWMNSPQGVLYNIMTTSAGLGGNGGGGDGAYGAIGGVPGATAAFPYPAPVTNVSAVAGTANRGGGGGGGISGQGIGPIPGQNGGSGVIIIRFKTYQRLDDNYFID